MPVQPRLYEDLAPHERRALRQAYMWDQGGKCMFCEEPFHKGPPEHITDMPIDWDLFPGGESFLDYPVHLQHNHASGMTEGAVHAYCNAVLWQYHNR